MGTEIASAKEHRLAMTMNFYFAFNSSSRSGMVKRLIVV